MKKQNCGGCQKNTCDGCRLFIQGKLHTDKESTEESAVKWQAVSGKGMSKQKKGMAFDVGTTTIAATLWDLESGQCLGAASCVNPQRKRGSDVVSRIAYCMEDEGHPGELHKLAVEAMDELAVRLMDAQQEKGTVTRAVVVGNTAMCQLVLGEGVTLLAKAPFRKSYTGCISKKGKLLGFSFLQETEIQVMPAIEGYVGADALSVYTYAKALGAGEKSLIVDIGTNGEMILIGKEAVYACSAAAGPALEGAAVQWGMLALPGAIAGIRLVGRFPGEDICCEVIGNAEPVGICGSGLMDGMALLYQEKVMDAGGYLKNQQEAAKDGVSPKLCRRLKTVNGENRFYLTKEKQQVYLSGRDIRQLQLAKGAIRAGIELLLQKEGIPAEEIERIYLAGAFGNDIRAESAMAVGLLPKVDSKKIISVGNGAGLGAAMALLYPKVKDEMTEASGKIIHVEPAQEKSFEELFLHFMQLP